MKLAATEILDPPCDASHHTPPPPAPALSTPARGFSSSDAWIDLGEAGRRSGQSIGHLRRMCKEKFAARGEARLESPEGGGKPAWRVSVAADPAFSPVKMPDQIPFDARQFTERHRAEIFDRKRILENLESAIAGGVKLGFTLAQITAQFLAHIEAVEGRPLCARTLRGWRSAYIADGLAGLSDQRREKKRCHGASPFLDIARDYFLRRKCSKRTAWEIACLKASQLGIPILGARATALHLEKIPRAAQILNRQGPEAFKNQCAPYIERDYRSLHSNEQWVGDHHQMDVMVRHHGKMIRPWLTAWMDMRSRFVVGWCIFAHDPNQNSILSALRAGCLAHGLPELLYIDNGKDFDAHAFHGRTKKQRLSGAARLDTGRVTGILNHLDIKARFCWAYNGQSKPIERFFGTLERKFGTSWPTYVGSSPENRPEQLEKRLENGEAPELQEFVASFDQWLDAGYHRSIHTGDGVDVGGSPATPAEAYANNFNGFARRTSTSGMLDLLLMRQTRPVKVGQNGVRLDGLFYGQYVLAPHFGREVYLRVDERDLASVQVWSADDRFICVAPCNEKLPANANDQLKREAIARHRSAAKAIRAAHRLRPTLTESMADTMIRAQSESNRAAAADRGDLPPAHPPHLKPHRSPLEDELPKVERAFDGLKIAVGAEGMSEPSTSSRFVFTGKSEEEGGNE